LSHLVLDEIYAVDAAGLLLRANKAAGRAFKLFSQSIPATLCTWLVLGALTYLVGIEQGYLKPIRLSFQYPFGEQKSSLPRSIPSNLPSLTPGSR
jgi:hypothetical protein